MNRAYRVALICGAGPLVVGCSIFVLWLVTRWQWLMIAGIFTLAGGPVICGLGFLHLATFHWLACRTPDLAPGRRRLLTFGGCTLLLLNIPAAGGILAAVVAIEFAYTVVVRNASARPLEDVRVRGGGCEVSFGSIPPQGVARRSFWIQHDGELGFEATSGSTTYLLHDFGGYVTNGQGGQRTITVNLDGTIVVTDEHGQPRAHEAPVP